MNSLPYVYVIGFVAQGLFSARLLVQWILSEKARKVVSPDIYWILSLGGSILFFLYGWLRHDFSIILGQFISYYIYIWNLSVKGIWRKVPRWIAAVVMLLPVLALSLMLNDAPAFVGQFLHNDSVPTPLLVFGSVGQIIFSLRFIYQWYYSYKRHHSILPVGFWIISLVGSGIIVTYGAIRLDPVLVIGQSVGFVAYLRNIIIGKKS